ncbi:cytochrome bc1 complex diheme cytochrome c subunit [Actinotalea fermentans]|uniref:Cytochrome bc1 complex cytochrome c subunit n=1 Tax=Actinotalea fermentans TaxID=43671 RepID=A0A511YU01_9CELL|nr:c-type cytochrome [Actinotalea fermentans]KGM17274.1 cystathionine beta-lyase [Actinotalea fermentans ATCC 43279 = JCM 9966 = DSM 3133]GEN78678.1 cystathionine beta-lyase [Actinotalea fermentans]
MKAIADRRHHRMAPVVLLLLALLLTGAVYAALSPTPAEATAASEDDIAAGAALFRTNCATCHGPGAEGRDGYPSLIGVGAAAVDFQVSTGRMPMQATGPQAPAKPPVFDEEQIAQLAAYVASLAPGPSIPTADQVDPAGGDAANGMALFRTNCAMCHGSIGRGGALTEGKYAPSLGGSTPTQIYEAMLTGPSSMPVFNDANITPEEKQDIIAFLEEQKQGSPGGTDLGAVGPVSEGLWVWVVGMGLLLGAAVWIGAKSA